MEKERKSSYGNKEQTDALEALNETISGEKLSLPKISKIEPTHPCKRIKD